MKTLLIIPFFLLVLNQSLNAADCSHRTAYVEPECNAGCVEPETCQPADANNEEFCCINMAQPRQNNIPTVMIVSIGALLAVGAGFYFLKKKKS